MIIALFQYFELESPEGLVFFLVDHWQFDTEDAQQAICFIFDLLSLTIGGPGHTLSDGHFLVVTVPASSSRVMSYTVLNPSNVATTLARLRFVPMATQSWA